MRGFWAAILLLYALLVLLVSVLNLGETPAADLNDKLGHFLIYALFAGIAARLVEQRHFVFLGLALVGYGLAMELLQMFLPWRSHSLADALANSLGIVAALALLAVLR